MADFKINGKNVITQSGVDEPVLASNVTIPAGRIGTAEIATDAVTATEIAASAIEVSPHIKPGKLYPAVAGKLLDGSTSHSGAYGTAQSDTRKYYYTDIKGSKPIKDPRIGAHFGSQRYKLKSMQLLEQETATQGANVYSFDGREYCRAVGTWVQSNTTYGQTQYVNNSGVASNTSWVEIIGYFSDANWSGYTSANICDVYISVDGGVQSTNTNMTAGASTPLDSRYVDAGSLVNLGLGETLGIHTLKIANISGEYLGAIYAVELIAQDTTSATTKSQIQIPSQNVVSYGKKFTVAGTPHYNPFAFKTDGTTAWTAGNHNGTAWPVGTGSSANIDTATSLGLDAWVSTNYYYPYNGGRVVVWVDSSGAIKTSVNMMPPNAKSWNDADIAKKANATAANDDHQPTFEAYTTSVGEDLLHEVAKTYNFREFGNGAANGGTGATYADASMLTGTSDAIAYVMDDGLTALSGTTTSCDTSGWHHTDLSLYDTNGTAYLVFIGTGISIKDQTADGTWSFGTIAQNLPYGTHVVTLVRDASTNGDHLVDGVACATNFLTGSYGGFSDVTFHQPKMPPIPEDAVVIADYMLMADTVQIPNTTAALAGHISKGMLRKNISRDFFFNPASGSTSPTLSITSTDGPFLLQNPSNGIVVSIDIPHFGTKFMVSGENAGSGAWASTYGGTAVSQTMIDNTSATNAMDKFSGPSTAKDLGINKLELDVNSGYGTRLVDMNTPIHTSSHYQTFETPYLHELVGGDRNMEQTNLVVTPDGKTWDEVTRDTSYVTNKSGYVATVDGVSGGFTNTTIKPDVYRGHGGNYEYFDSWNKDFAIAYDRFICLKGGMYRISYTLFSSGNNGAVLAYLQLNNSTVGNVNRVASAVGDQDGDNITWRSMAIMEATIYLKRGDFICVTVDSGATVHGGTDGMNRFHAERVG